MNLNTPVPAEIHHLVMARDRYQLLRLKSGKFRNEKAYQQLLEKSQQAVQKRAERLPKITLNEDLPVSQNADSLIKAIQEYQVIIVAGETGSGKTTQLPKIAMLAGRGLTGMIGHTQPRRLAARSVSQRIAEELGEPLGKSVGFKVRFNETGNSDAFVRLMTDGILLAELGNDRFLNKYDTIIIDEAHERSLNIDFLLGYIRQILPKRPDLKVIVTSATLDVNRFSQYFADASGQGAPIFEVEGRSYSVEVRYRPVSELSVGGSDDDAFDDVEENLPRAVVAAVEECYEDAINKGHPEHADILVFASTEQEIRDLQETLRKFGPRHTEILPLYARLALSEQQKIFSPSGKGRRIIIATNVAETALTVPNIRYVIDSGFARISRYSYRSRVQRLPIEAISQAAANQRKGRCGRIAPGVCIRLYSEDDFLGRPEFTEPEIKRTNLASVILQMQNLGLGELDNFDFIEPPDHRLVNDGKKLLIELGALTERKSESKLTKIGQMMAKMPIDPRLARMILGGAHFGVLNEVLIVVSALAVQDPRERPADKQTQADQKHALFKEADSDFLFYLKLWETIAGQKGQEGSTPLSERQRRQFAKQHFLSWLRLREWRQTHQQLVDLAQQLKLSFNRVSDPQLANYENLHRALLTGLLSFVAQKTDEKNIYQAVKQQKARIFPASTLHKQGAPWLMAFEMVETSQVYLRTLAKIEPEWILLAARDLLKYHYFEPHWSKKSGTVNAYAQISLFGLIIQPKQPCNYEKVNQADAHEIFLRDALVTGNLGINPPFLQHNVQKIAEVERIEDKLRRRDLLVDEETLYQFYAARIPEHIASRRAFEDWRAEVEAKNSRVLFLSNEDVLLDNAPKTNQFPDYWQVGQLRLATRYVFDPSRDDDGATVSIPVQALPQVDSNALSWGIPGWRQQLVEALLKSLPKDKRRLFVPIPDTAKKLLTELNPQQGNSLTAQLAFLLRGEQIREQDFDLNSVPNFLRPVIQVIDDKKRLIAQGRDLEELQARCRVATHQPVQQQQGELLDFPASFEFETQKKVTGLLVSQYHALVPVEANSKQPDDPKIQNQKGVLIQSYNDESEAKRHHRQGLLRLASLQLGDLSRQLKKQLPKSLVLAFAPLGTKAQLEDMLIYATLDVSFDGLAFSQAEFEHKLSQTRAQFLTQGQQVLTTLTDIFSLWQSIRRQMLVIDTDIFGRSLDDIEDQLDGLQLADFVYQIDSTHWQEYPRYLKALNTRLERLPNNLKKDTEGVVQIDPFMEKLLKFMDKKQLPKNPQQQNAFEEFRWLLEEWRISLFAQPMKTRVPVSQKRLEKAWQTVG
ncbi:ATP-dependent RNA helicase HrpA [Alkanindiges sp. WGS2144]|uniref:ATP-dependent RNA helicase HrpA n=1 Tax=Alkanindiges sp. WGS2144 TaxID=3366808 RepID=UPI0037510485